MNDLLYKYRGIENFRFFVDIIMKNRLFAAKYKDLNDPMEGQYYYNTGQYETSIIDKIASEKENLRLCSLSRVKDHELMWSHYAEGHRGVVIGLQVSEEHDVRPVRYTGLAYLNGDQIAEDTPREILSHKLNVWEYEAEERVFVRNSDFINVRVREVITGRAMSNQNYGFIKDLVERIDPNIIVIKASNFM